MLLSLCREVNRCGYPVQTEVLRGRAVPYQRRHVPGAEDAPHAEHQAQGKVSARAQEAPRHLLTQGQDQVDQNSVNVRHISTAFSISAIKNKTYRTSRYITTMCEPFLCPFAFQQ
jgi:hypothetical protein